MICEIWRYRFILMALFLSQQDLGLVDLEDFKYGGTNITAFRLVDPDNPQVTDVTSDWVMDEMKTGASPLENEQGIRVSILFSLKGGGGVYMYSMYIVPGGKSTSNLSIPLSYLYQACS